MFKTFIFGFAYQANRIYRLCGSNSRVAHVLNSHIHNSFNLTGARSACFSYGNAKQVNFR